MIDIDLMAQEVLTLVRQQCPQVNWVQGREFLAPNYCSLIYGIAAGVRDERSREFGLRHAVKVHEGATAQEAADFLIKFFKTKELKMAKGTKKGSTKKSGKGC